MFLALLLILLIAFSGFVLTYLFAEDESFLWRISAGNIVGSTIFGLIGFVVACFFGLSVATASLSILLTLVPLILLARNEFRSKLNADWTRSRENLRNANLEKFLNFSYYAFFFVLFVFFFDRAMLTTSAGILTGGSQNLGDLPFHLGAIFSFADGNNFPPQNPSFVGATFSYPFIADLLTAFLMKFDANVESAMLAQNVSWAFSLLVILEKLTFKLTNNRLAGKLAPALLFFSGGLGFLLFYKEFAAQGKGLYDFLLHLPSNYTIGDKTFRWGNSLNVLFITQRSLLLGMPLTIIILNRLWEIFSNAEEDEEKRRRGDEETGRQGNEETKNSEISEVKSANSGDDNSEKKSPRLLVSFSPFLPVSSSLLSPLLLGLLAGTLPLVHLHSLIVLFVVAAFLFVLKLEKWREWLIFGIGVSIIAVPELVWSMHGSASHAGEFFGWHFGWDKGDDENFALFWLKNTGAFLPLMLAGIGLMWREFLKNNNQESTPSNRQSSLLQFYLPFLFCFVIANVYRFAPWQWDNIKILIYWFAGSLPFAAYALARAWQKNVGLKIIAAVCFFALIAAGALDVWRVVTGQINYNVFEADAVKIAEQIKQKTPADAVILNAPTYNTPAVLSGRLSLMRYVGHLSSHGIDYEARLGDLQKMYEGDATAGLLMKKYNIGYVLISPEERGTLSANEEYFSRFPVVAESGQYKLYKVN